MTKEELVEIIEKYLWRITHANDCLQLYKTIVNAKQTRLKEMNYAPAFFTVVERSILNDLLMTTAKLFDNPNNTMSIGKLINICSENKQYFLEIDDKDEDPYVETDEINLEEIITRATAELEELKPIIDNLKKRRNKSYAHHDQKYFLASSKLQLDAPLRFDNLESLLKFADNVCNDFLCKINKRSFFTQSSNIEDLMRLLNKLHDYETKDHPY